MVDDFAYVNARVRGLRGALLGEDLFGALIGAGSLDGALRILGDTAYGPALASALSRRQGIEALDEGVGAALHEALSLLPRISSGRCRALLLAVSGRLEIQTLKALLRGVHRHAPAGEILSSCLPSGRLDEVALRELAQLGTIEELLAQLRLWSYPGIAEVQRSWRRHGAGRNLQRLEHALDKAFTRSSLGMVNRLAPDSPLLAFLRLQVDADNTLTALRLAAAGAPREVAEESFLPGGKSLHREYFLRLCAAGGAAEAVRAMGSNLLGGVLAPALPPFLESGKLSLFESALEEHLLSAARRLAACDPLGPGLAAGLVREKAREAHRLRTIGRGLQGRLPRAEIERQAAFGAARGAAESLR